MLMTKEIKEWKSESGRRNLTQTYERKKGSWKEDVTEGRENIQ